MRQFERFLRVLALGAGWVILALMLYTVADVVLRYVFNAPFSGSLETTEFAMSLIVFLGIAYCGWTGGHIAVDLFEKMLNRPSLRLLPVVISCAGGALFAIIAWRVTVETIGSLHQLSNMLRMPHYPFRFAVALCSAIFAVVMFVQAVGAARRSPR